MMLDTSYVVDLLREHANAAVGPATEFLRAHRDHKLRMPVFVLCELQLGAKRSKRPSESLRSVERLCEFIEPVDPHAGFASTYASVVAKLLDAGTPIPVMDALIGSLSLLHSEPLVTSDVQHFSKIDDLVVLAYANR